MFNFSKKSVQRVYQSIVCDEELPQELEEYRDILKVICSDVNYSSNLKNILFALVLVTKNDSLIQVYLDKLKEEEIPKNYEKKIYYYKIIYDTRIDFFDINDSYLQLLIERYKNSGVLGNRTMFSLENVLYGLSLDLEKMKNMEIDVSVKSELISCRMINLLMKSVIVNGATREEFEEIDCLVNMASLNRDLALEICTIYDELIRLREIYQEYIGSLGMFVSPLSITLVFIRELLIYHLSSNKEISISSIKNIISKAIAYSAESGGKISPIVSGFDPMKCTNDKYSYFDTIIAKEISKRKESLLLSKVSNKE